MNTIIKEEMPLTLSNIESSIRYYEREIKECNISSPEKKEHRIYNEGCLSVWKGLKNDYIRININN